MAIPDEGDQVLRIFCTCIVEIISALSSAGRHLILKKKPAIRLFLIPGVYVEIKEHLSITDPLIMD